jgi:SET domain-containing protein
MILPILTIAPSDKKGRGVFTSADIAKGTTIEIAPVIVLNKEEREKVEQTLLYDYIFEWGDDLISAAGYVSIYNHAIHPNCKYEMDFDHLTISIITIADIAAGEELFINYNAEEAATTPVWFEMH